MIFLTACGSGAGTAAGANNSSTIQEAATSKIQQTAVSATGNPLVAQYSVTTSGTATIWIEFGPGANYGFNTAAQTTPAGGGSVNFLVAGMKQNTLYHMRAVVNSAGGTVYDQDQTFQTGAIPPAQLPSLHVTTSPGQHPTSGVELLSLTGGTPNQLLSLAVNPTGDIIWYYQYNAATGEPNLTKLLPNGHMLMILSIPGPPPDFAVQEIDLAGNVIRQFTLADIDAKLRSAGYNLSLFTIDHDVLLLPNGHMLFITTDQRTFTDLPGYPGQTTVTGNAIIDVDENNNPDWVWDAFDHLDVNRHPMNFPDWTHANALFYSPSDGNFLLSVRHQHWILKIDFQNGQGTGDILWKLGYQGDFTLLNSTSPADWFYAQHDANIASPNTTGNFQLAVFDNGDNRVLDDNGDVCNPTGPPMCYSTTALFNVNETNMTAQRQWSYQLPYSYWGGVTQKLANSHIFYNESSPIDLGNTNSRVAEVTQTANPTKLWELDIYNQNSYRTVHLPSLYPGVQW